MSKKTPIRVAVIGAGNMGRHHVRNYSALDAAKLIAIVDMNPDMRSLAEEHGAKYYSDYKLMLDEMKPDAVSVVVPTPFHAEVGLEVLSRGIHLLMEKPIALTISEADKLIELAKEKKVVFTVGHIERYNPIVRKLKELIDEGRLGNITSIVSKRVGGFPAVEPKSDVVTDLAVHDIEIISFLLNRYPISIFSHGSRTLHSKEIDAAELLLDYGEASGFVQANWTTPVKVRTIAVTGSNGYVEGNYITQELEYYQHNMQPRRPDNEFKSFVDAVGDPQKEIIKVDFKEPLALELSLFIQTINREIKHRLVSPIDAREALRFAIQAAEQQSNRYEEQEKELTI